MSTDSSGDRLQFRSNEITILRYFYAQALGAMAGEALRAYLETGLRIDSQYLARTAMEIAIAALKNLHETEQGESHLGST